jgi:hypothetical protein
MQNTIVSLLQKEGDWWSAIFLILGLVMFFPVGILTEISERAGRRVGWRYIILLEVVVVGLVVVTMILLKRFYPELSWFAPLVGIGLSALIRGAMWCFGQLSSSDDDL